MKYPCKPVQLLCLPLLISPLLAACQKVPPAQPTPSTAAAQGRAFAQATCSGCHSIGLYGTSSNPNAPPFGYVANQEGVTRETLTAWLKSAHNYPMEMDFTLSEQESEMLVAYLLTLKDPNYRRPPD